MQVTSLSTFRAARVPAARLLRVWALPVLTLLAAALLLRLGLHARWLDLVWSLRTLEEPVWFPVLTRLRFALDDAAVGLGALTAALVLRFEPGRGRLALSGLLLILGVLGSGLLADWLGVTGEVLLWAALVGLGGLWALGHRWHTRPARRWGEAALLLCLLVFTAGFLPTDLLGRPQLVGSLRLGVWWNELGRPVLRDLGFLVFLVGAGLAWLEQRPGVLRSGLARGTVLAGLAGFTALVYVGVVGGVGTLLGAENSLWLGLLAAVLIAVGFGSVRAALGHAVNRLLYGARDDPFQITRQLGLALSLGPDPRVRLEAALSLLSGSLRLPGVALHLLDGEVLESGPVGDGAASWPLVVGGERVGTLTAGRRSAREALSAADHRLLEAVAGQLADAAHAWQLEGALRRSRDSLVRAGEDERRRLRRDLHDGLGPALSGLGLKLEAARLLLARSPERAGAHLAELQNEVQGSVNEVRRLVHDLRPPKLDDLGLLGALEEVLAGVQGLGLTARFEAPAALPPLGAAAEVAIYRVAQEALTNVVKHAHARQVVLRLRTDARQLTLEIEDDGVGLPEVREPGVGSQSMRERAEALSGTLAWLGTEGGGTLVRAVLPLGEAPA